jgi:uncharacterized protein
VNAEANTFIDRYGKWALVLGASDGTGACFARIAAERGLNVALVARRAGLLDDVAAELREASGVEARAIPLDLAEPTAATRLADATADLEVGLLIMNAGADDHGRDFLDVPLEEWIAMVQRNNVLTVQAVHHFGMPMRERGRGGIILMSSDAGWGGGARLAIYSASKAFDRNLAEGLWAELAPFGVDVLSLVAPPTDTPALLRLLDRAGRPAVGLAVAEDVARAGLDHLDDGPVHIPHEVPEGPATAAGRRELVQRISEGSKAFFAD